MRFGAGLVLALGLGACTAQSAPIENLTAFAPAQTGINPNIVVGDVAPEDAARLSAYIDEAVALLRSPAFAANYARASDVYPELYVSKSEDVISSAQMMERLKTQDSSRAALWWPKTFVILRGAPATRLPDRTGFGFDAVRTAAAGPFPRNAGPTPTGEIELGRLHFARYARGDTVERSCALNTMVHEISHTLSDKPNQFYMHILDTQKNVTPPQGIYEASYFIGTVAQCTYLQIEGRVSETGFEACLQTFSNPEIRLRFKSVACDDFPGDTPITPAGWAAR